jgi:hypothetical protein
MTSLQTALMRCDVSGVMQCLRADTLRAGDPLDILCMSDYVDQRPKEFLECARLLVKAGALVNTSSGALQLCMTRADATTFTEFLKITRADPNHIGCTSSSSPHPPLLLALILRSVSNVQSLLKAGANPMLGELNGGNQGAFAISPAIPLHEAVAWGRWDVVQDLLAHGADPFQKDPIRGLVALDWARHAAHAPSAAASTDITQILTFFEHIEHARKMHGARVPVLYKELVEYVFHPHRLQKQGYFCFNK